MQLNRNSPKISLLKYTPPYKIEIEFYPRPPYRKNEKKDESEDEIDPEKDYVPDLCDFNLYIHKDDSKYFVAECMSFDSRVNIHHMAFLETRDRDSYNFLYKDIPKVNFNLLSLPLQDDILD